jgi:DNA polymerase-3 subunit beta
MQLTIERSALLKALGHVQSVVERRNTIPILSNVLLSAGRDRLSFAATDLDMEMVDEAEAQVNVEGQITAPAHTLYEIVKKLPDGAEVSLTYSGDDPRLVISAGRSRFNLPVLPAGDFPVMSTESTGARYSLPKEDLARLIDKTRFAISTEETRYYLNGIFLHVADDNGAPVLKAAATTAKALADSRVTVTAPQGVALPGPDLPCAGSTEPFSDGMKRSHLTRHPEFKCFETVVSRR